MATSNRGRQGEAAATRGFTPTDLGLVLLVTALIRTVSGAQRFTFLHTPDSEFYYSLGAFGSAITDRAPIDYYYWTKLGIILPVRALVGGAGLDPVMGLDVFHIGLLLLVVGSAYVVARLRLSRLGSCVAAAFAALNTVVLGFVGDPYASGAALAGLSVLLATATVWTFGQRPFGWAPPALMGLAGSWLVMINPYALIVGAAGCAGIVLANARVVLAAGTPALARAVGALLAGFALGFGAFLAGGSWVFPGLNWFTSLGEFLFNADLSAWTDPTYRWVQTEITLLVPVIAAVVSLLALAMDPRSKPTRAAVGLTWVTIGVAIGYKLFSDSNVLEVSVYNSMLWPSALLALVLVASTCEEPAIGWGPVALAVVAPIGWIAAGHWSSVVSTPVALVAASLAILVAAGLLVWGRRVRVIISTALPIASVGLVMLAVVGSVFQVLQNGRPEFPEGTHRRVAYSSAFLPNPAGDRVVQDAVIQSWLIGATAPHEQLVVWNEAETRSAASMQLWGSNTAGSGFGGPLEEAGMSRIRSLQPNAVVVYASDPDSVAALRTELEAEWTVADPTCQEFVSSTSAPSMEVCLLRLTDPGEGTSP